MIPVILRFFFVFFFFKQKTAYEMRISDWSSDVCSSDLAMDEMWDQYGGVCTTELVELIVNGNEAAAFVQNHMKTDDGIVTIPSLETYKVENGKLHIRYFHRSEHYYKRG